MAIDWFGRKKRASIDSGDPSITASSSKLEKDALKYVGEGDNALRTPHSSFGLPFAAKNGSHRSLAARSITGRSITGRSVAGSLYGFPAPTAPRPFKSYRLSGEYEKPWLQDRHYSGRERADKLILGFCALVGVAIAAILCYDGWTSLAISDYCLVLDDDFSTFNESVWTREVGVGGYGYGSFDWTTEDPLNSYVSGDGLHIVPTLTTETTKITAAQIANNFTLNLTADGTCTSPAKLQCVITSNATNGGTNGTIINPVRSARLTTAQKVAIKYGRVEVVAKMPKGDWLWPSIWMYPEKETYGIWPRSGEIDIALVRGNAPSVVGNGRDTITSTMHWGAGTTLDQSDRTTGNMTIRRQDLSEGFHTFGMEWSESHFFTWVDDRVVQVMSTQFGSKLGTMYERAQYAIHWYKKNGTYVQPVDAWSQTARFNTPFDQPFHLILNVAVGSQNGFFDNSLGNKPWVDASGGAMRSFWNAQSLWLPTWGDGDERGMTVKSVKMWQEGKCGS